MKKFEGIAPFTQGFSLYYFSPKARVQQLIHSLKYSYQPEALLFLGRVLGDSLQSSSSKQIFDWILPVPLHPRRAELRGYNQSTLLAEGVSEVIGVPVLEGALRRNVDTKTQTGKARIQRWGSMVDAFDLAEAFVPGLAGKDILLVDDLVTTGATLSACAKHLMEASPRSICFATLAFALEV